MDEDEYRRIIDGHLREATERGDFEDLPGMGKPLPDDGMPYDEQWWVKGLIEREGLDMTAALPPSLAVRKEVQRLPETLAALTFESAVREHVEALNQRIRQARLNTVGGPPVVLRDIDVDEAVREWRDARRRTANTTAAPASKGVDSTAGVGSDTASAPGFKKRRWWQRGSSQ